MIENGADISGRRPSIRNRLFGSTRETRRFRVVALLLTGLGLAARWYGVWTYEFWTDELHSLRMSRDWGTIRNYCFHWLSSPPTRYVLTHFLIQRFYDFPEIYRLPSLICGVLSIPVSMTLARRWWNEGAGYWAGLLVAFSPWMIAHSQDGRMHIAAMFFFLLGVTLATVPGDRFRKTCLVSAGICWAISSSITYPAVLACAGGFAFFALARFRTPWGRLLKEVSLLAGPWALWLAVWFGPLLLLAPNSPLEGTAVFATETAKIAGPAETGNQAPAAPQAVPLYTPPPFLWTWEFYRGVLRGAFGDGPLRWLTLLGGVWFMAGTGTARTPNRAARIALLAVPFALVLSQKPPQFYPRYLLALLPFATMGAAAMAGTLARATWSRALVFVVFLGLSLPPSYQILTHSPQPWRAAMDHVVERWERYDKLLVGTHQAEYGVFLYNAGRIPKEALVFRVFNGLKLEEETLGNSHGRWLIQWFDFPPVVQEAMDRWYTKEAVFQGRYGKITLYKKRTQESPLPSGEG